MAHHELEPLRRMGLLSTRSDRDPATPALAPDELIGVLTVEARALADCAAIEPAWRALARSAIERNAFFEPGFLLAASRHLPEAQGYLALLAWAPEIDGTRRLVGFWPMRPAKHPRLHALHRGFHSRYASAGTPLLDARLALEAATALIRKAVTLGGRESAILFNEIALDGPAARAVRAASLLSGLGSCDFDTRARACVWGTASGSLLGTDERAKARGEDGRSVRKLARHGDVTHLIASEPGAVRDALELFLALESSGWKARRGTAILSRPRDAAFFRAMSRAMAREGRIAVHMIQANDRVAAAGLVLGSAEQAWYLKTAYDEQLSEASPGAVLSRRIAEGFQQSPDALLLDSCAIPGHRMIERVWRGRLRVGDLIVGEAAVLERAAAQQRSWRMARNMAKLAYYRLLGRPL